ncbi:uncharacterized protein Dvar_45630 [Desulfosarcina variabilis str. Montpellier]|uniref:hypothetical protein n=1 Tax=Desulfosarcina variabilis TaxID=2300 RepID=UPI003AFA44E7
MIQKPVMQRVAEFSPNQRISFYENLISMLAAEVEACYPDGARPGEEYDKAIRKVTSLIRIKGKVHAFFKLNIKGDLFPERQARAAYVVEAGVGDMDFLRKMVKDLDGEPDIQKRVSDILSGVLGRV